MTRMRMLLAIALPFAGASSSGEEPKAKSESWMHVYTMKGSWVIRVDGGPAKQVEWRPPEDKRRKFIPDARTDGWLSPDGKSVLYFDEDPTTRGEGKKSDEARSRIMLADADGKNPKQVLTGLSWWAGYIYLTPDGKALVCGAEEKGKWYPFRIAFDGTVAKLSETSGIDAPVVLPRTGGRYLYHPITEKETVKSGPFSSVVTKGPIIVIDGKKETVLVKEPAGFPEFTMDVTKMARSGKNEKGQEVIEITDLKTGKKEEIPLTAFDKDWNGQFRWLKFSPDGNALAMLFSVGETLGSVEVVKRDKGPLPGDEAVEHFGVIWFDGRKDRTALFRIDQPREKGGRFAGIHDFEWLTEPPAKK
jgi:hypothetical protein